MEDGRLIRVENIAAMQKRSPSQLHGNGIARPVHRFIAKCAQAGDIETRVSGDDP
jgi:hypothetical protein